jgi:hypothetical protein
VAGRRAQVWLHETHGWCGRGCFLVLIFWAFPCATATHLAEQLLPRLVAKLESLDLNLVHRGKGKRISLTAAQIQTRRTENCAFPVRRATPHRRASPSASDASRWRWEPLRRSHTIHESATRTEMRPTRGRCPSLLNRQTRPQTNTTPLAPSTCPAKHQTFGATDNGRDPCICTMCVRWMCTRHPGRHGAACRIEILVSREPPAHPHMQARPEGWDERILVRQAGFCPPLPGSSHRRRRCVMDCGAVRVDPAPSPRKRAPSAAPPGGWHHVVLRDTEIHPLRAAAATSLRSPTPGQTFGSSHALQPPLLLPCTCNIKSFALHTISFLLVRTRQWSRSPLKKPRFAVSKSSMSVCEGPGFPGGGFPKRHQAGEGQAASARLLCGVGLHHPK